MSEPREKSHAGTKPLGRGSEAEPPPSLSADALGPALDTHVTTLLGMTFPAKLTEGHRH
jgi:hypothetical protein